MRQIRLGVFETNSSSTHSLTICTCLEFNEWKAGKRYFYNERLIDEKERNEIEDRLNNENISKNRDHWSYDKLFIPYTEYMDDCTNELESYVEHFTTPSKDEMVVFGQYGYNG